MGPQKPCNVFRGALNGLILNEEIQRELRPDEVYVDVTHSSLCGTDQFYTKMPQVLGHEGVGIVREIGSAVTSVKVGDRVGMHYRQKICRTCQDCNTGWDQYCLSKQDYAKLDPNQGTLAKTMTWHESTLIPIPLGCESANAATLMCSGATVWTVLTGNNLPSGARVGVLGIGGLGHLAIKIASALNYHVVALSSSDRKREDCLGWGAKEYIVYNPSQTKPPRQSIALNALLLCAGHSTPDFTTLFPLMATHGTIFVLTIDFTPSSISSLGLIDRGLSIKGSHVASLPAMREMFDFCTERGVVAEMERFPFTIQGVGDAFQALEGGRVRYKAVVCREV